MQTSFNSKMIVRGVLVYITMSNDSHPLRHAILQAMIKSKSLNFTNMCLCERYGEISFVVEINTNQAKQGKRVYYFKQGCLQALEHVAFSSHFNIEDQLQFLSPADQMIDE